MSPPKKTSDVRKPPRRNPNPPQPFPRDSQSRIFRHFLFRVQKWLADSLLFSNFAV